MSRPGLIDSFGLGLAAGMRSTMPLAVSAARARRGPFPGRPNAWLAAPATERLLRLLALGELVVDKLPVTPPRTAPPALAARLVSGALTAAANAGSPKGPILLAGALGALLAAHAMERLRMRAGRRTGLPDAVIGLAEDALAFGLARRCSATSAHDSEVSRHTRHRQSPRE